jgi:hypothetical protein
MNFRMIKKIGNRVGEAMNQSANQRMGEKKNRVREGGAHLARPGFWGPALLREPGEIGPHGGHGRSIWPKIGHVPGVPSEHMCDKSMAYVWLSVKSGLM